MKYDTIITGGGLSGLVAGISLMEKGRKAAIISSGQGALHFSTGSFGLYGTDGEGNDVANPIEAIASLGSEHPYSKIGVERVAELAETVVDFFGRAGITLTGIASRNHYRLTPMGALKPTWLSSADCAVTDDAEHPDPGRVAVVGLRGYQDFFPGFIASGLEKKGVECTIHTIALPELETLRKSAAEMRAPSIAKVLRGETLENLAKALLEAAPDAATYILPAVIGLRDEKPMEKLRKLTGRRIAVVPTQPMSVTGMRIMTALRRRFESLGGTYLLGDNVTAGLMQDNRMVSLDTTNLGKAALEADTYILATGSYFSRGLIADPEHIYEPIFGFDVDAPADRQQWFDSDFFKPQPYMSYGVRTDGDFHVSAQSKRVENVYAVGAILGGCNPLKEGSGSGVAILTAMDVASKI